MNDPILLGIAIAGIIVLFLELFIGLGMLFPVDSKEKIAMDNLDSYTKSSNFSCNMGCYRMGMETIKRFNDSNAGIEKFDICSNYCLETFGDGTK
jgi:hypothetical protein